MYVILDMHAAPGGQGRNSEISDYDPSKPSLWESERNKTKLVQLWKKIAERYKDNKWIGGYDLINETNWDLPGGVALRDIYERITTELGVLVITIFYLLKEMIMETIMLVLHRPGMRIWFTVFINIGTRQTRMT